MIFLERDGMKEKRRRRKREKIFFSERKEKKNIYKREEGKRRRRKNTETLALTRKKKLPAGASSSSSLLPIGEYSTPALVIHTLYLQCSRTENCTYRLEPEKVCHNTVTPGVLQHYPSYSYSSLWVILLFMGRGEGCFPFFRNKKKERISLSSIHFTIWNQIVRVLLFFSLSFTSIGQKEKETGTETKFRPNTPGEFQS